MWVDHHNFSFELKFDVDICFHQSMKREVFLQQMRPRMSNRHCLSRVEANGEMKKESLLHLLYLK